ncbi:MAG: hypothetical protein J6V89_00845, partial [Acetobacter sp.]|nr:hypothetical protein [Acetobacter sp.]
LPEGTQVTIIDLPGLKAVNDERNARVIRENIVNAFCLMAYSAEEVDGLKQEDLLDQVVNQVMALNYKKDEEEKTETNQHQGHVSDLSRMLFLLNRIDVFYKHENADKQLEKFKGEVTDQLRERLKRALPQREDVVDYLNKIELVQICSGPEFYAVNLDRLWEKPDEQVKIVEKIDNSYKTILPKNEKGKNWFREFFKDLEELRDDPKEYSTDKRRAIIKRLIDDTLKGSRADDFEKHLKASIINKLPDIIIGGYVNVMNLAYNRLLGKVCYLLETNKNRTVSSFCEYMLRKIVNLG